jgi:hypothetical protein
MMPDERMSRIPAKRLTENDKCVFVPIYSIVCCGKLYGDLRIVGQRPRLLYFLDLLVDPAWIVCPDPVRLFQETFCHESPGAAPKPPIIAILNPPGRLLLQKRRHVAAQGRPFDLPAHLDLAT